MQAFGAIPDEEGGPRITHDGIERRHDGADPLKTENPDGNQQRIGNGAGGADGKHMRTRQPLLQNEGILRADGDDEAEAHRQASEEDLDVHARRGPCLCPLWSGRRRCFRTECLDISAG
jgi:hypothetical protein